MVLYPLFSRASFRFTKEGNVRLFKRPILRDTLRDVYITSGSVTSGMLCKDGVLGIKAVFVITRNQNYI